MDSAKNRLKPTVIFNFRFLTTALVGSLVMALVAVFGDLSAQIAMLGSWVSVLAGLIVSYVEQDDERERRRHDLLRMVSVPVTLARERTLLLHYRSYSEALEKMADQTDSILRQFVMLKLANIGEQLQMLADGTIIFSDTEVWRTIYDQFLRSPDITKYWSVAWVKSPEYWQDQPGRQSLDANFAAVRRGVMIHRLVIIADSLWPDASPFPTEPIRAWLDEQHNQGIWIGLVRESEVAHESDLLADIGIYGDRAIGVQELDSRSRTLRFVLSFDAEKIQDAKTRWERLKLYAVSYLTVLDRTQTTE